jgi:hypothetical protein
LSAARKRLIFLEVLTVKEVHIRKGPIKSSVARGASTEKMLLKKLSDRTVEKTVRLDIDRRIVRSAV